MQFKDRFNPLGLGMNLITQFAKSNLPDQLHIRKQSEQALEFISKQTVKLMQGGLTGLPLIGGKKSAAASQTVHVAGETKLLLDFSLNADQALIKETLDDFAMQVLRPAASSANDHGCIPSELLQQTNAMGLASFVVPEGLGGTATSRSPLTSSIIIQSLSRGDMGLGLAALCPMSFANAISHWGTPGQKAEYLAQFLNQASGANGPMATIALNEPSIDFNPHKPQCTATKVNNGWELTGTKCLVPMAQRSHYILLSAQTHKGVRLFIVKPDNTGVVIKNTPAMGLKAAELASVQLKHAFVTEAACLGDSDFDFGLMLQMAQIAWCALTVGAAQAVLDYVIPYCNERQAFGEPISNRQAVAFMIANIGIELESMRVLTERATSQLENGQDAQRAVFLAMTQCAMHSVEIATNGVQLLGGHGFTKEHPVERLYRDLRASAFLINGLHV